VNGKVIIFRRLIPVCDGDGDEEFLMGTRCGWEKFYGDGDNSIYRVTL